ncbi:52 kDa repressor of the inhibitor of the protein kinase-like [Sitophilus oryzae]|uniref:52 kDa repressor of the inhibitor of the protein kinase-like n=1 Tax=Sitophilus oryzae TaxID=7048 RepID=A0A6J2YVF1_SITOR|nr:52 kDa repressor of the inhibitor of the protein kinase-like [Sitophilus oryzae]
MGSSNLLSIVVTISRLLCYFSCRAKIWIEACNRSDILEKKTKYYRLCELHFEEQYFSKLSTERKRLLPNAIPTIFSNIVPRVNGKETPSKNEEIPSKKIKILADIMFKPASENPVSDTECPTHFIQDTPSTPTSHMQVCSPNYFQGPSTSKEVQVEPQIPSSLFCSSNYFQGPSTSKEVQVEPQTPSSLFCSSNYFQGKILN